MTAVLTLVGVLGAALIGAGGSILADRLKRRDAEADRHNEVMEAVNGLSGKVDVIERKLDETVAVQARIRIIRFADEIQHGTLHSQDHFRQILEDIRVYDNYCNDDGNRSFRNGITTASEDLINETYADCLRKGTFI